jgi:uncharacterized protein (TIGR00369 family)
MAAKKHLAGHDTRYMKLQKNHCFACGTSNPDGMRLRFTYDEERDCFVCRFRLGKRYTGPPGHCHGGIIATILDEAMGKVNKLRHVVALTSEITVNYLKPVPLQQPLRVESREVKVKGRKHINMAEILNKQGEVLARGQGLFIAIDANRMFAKFVDR